MSFRVSYSPILRPYLYDLQNNGKLPAQEVNIILDKAREDQEVIANDWLKEIEAHEKTKIVAFVAVGVLGVLCAVLAFKIFKK